MVQAWSKFEVNKIHPAFLQISFAIGPIGLLARSSRGSRVSSSPYHERHLAKRGLHNKTRMDSVATLDLRSCSGYTTHRLETPSFGIRAFRPLFLMVFGT